MVRTADKFSTCIFPHDTETVCDATSDSLWQFLPFTPSDGAMSVGTRVLLLQLEWKDWRDFNPGRYAPRVCSATDSVEITRRAGQHCCCPACALHL